MKASAPLNTGTTIESRDGGGRSETTPEIPINVDFVRVFHYGPRPNQQHTLGRPQNAIASRDFSGQSYPRGGKGVDDRAPRYVFA
jgi:hypothetical protein